MKTRNFISAFFILIYGIVMAVFGYMGHANFVDGQSLIFTTLVLASMAIAAFWAIWNLELRRRQADTLYQGEKRKRETLDSVLRDMSADDLGKLKRRLLADESNGWHEEDDGEVYLGGYKR